MIDSNATLVCFHLELLQGEEEGLPEPAHLQAQDCRRGGHHSGDKGTSIASVLVMKF